MIIKTMRLSRNNDKTNKQKSWPCSMHTHSLLHKEMPKRVCVNWIHQFSRISNIHQNHLSLFDLTKKKKHLFSVLIGVTVSFQLSSHIQNIQLMKKAYQSKHQSMFSISICKLMYLKEKKNTRRHVHNVTKSPFYRPRREYQVRRKCNKIYIFFSFSSLKKARRKKRHRLFEHRNKCAANFMDLANAFPSSNISQMNEQWMKEEMECKTKRERKRKNK